MKDIRNDNGFTLVEILMAVFIGLILLGAVYVSMNSGQRTSAGVERKVAAQQDVRSGLEVMAMEISMASFDPNLVAGSFWVNPNTCTNPSANQTYKGIQVATPKSLTIEMDINQNSRIYDSAISTGADCTVPTKDCNEIISYVWDDVNEYIKRETNCSGPQPFLGDVTGAVEGTRTVRVKNTSMGINNGFGVPAIFRYYDGKNAEINIDTSAGINPNRIPDIRRIDIALGVWTEEVDPNTHTNKQMIYSTSVLVRNHVLN